MSMARLHQACYIVVALLASQGYGLENTKVLPKGVRNLNIKSVDTSIDSKSDRYGRSQPLGKPLEQNLTFGQILKGKPADESRDLKAFLLANNLDESQSVGSFTADLKGKMKVIAPVLGYGLTDSLTLAVAVPYYQAKTAISVGFKQTSTAQEFVGYLADPANNQVANAREASGQFNNAVSALNSKLSNGGYRTLEDWSDSSVGDVTIAAKKRWVRNSIWSTAFTAGTVAPTGKVEDPDILNDIAFGDGQWDLFGQLAVDQSLGRWAFIDQYIKYTWQAPGRRELRLVTPDETLAVPKGNVDFDLGDRFEAGLSINYESPWGLVSGLGYNFLEKAKDKYVSSSGDHLTALETSTFQSSHNGEFSLGYSTVAAYQRGKFAIPFEVKASLVRQFASINLPITNLAVIDANLYF